MQNTAKERLAELKQTIENEDISYGELLELESLKEYIGSSDVGLLEWAGVEENLATYRVYYKREELFYIDIEAGSEEKAREEWDRSDLSSEKETGETSCTVKEVEKLYVSI